MDLKELKKRFTLSEEYQTTLDDNLDNTDLDENKTIFRKSLPEDPEDLLVKGNWIVKTEDSSSGNGLNPGTPEFLPDLDGIDVAVKVGKVSTPSQPKKTNKGLQVMFSNDPNNPDSPIFKEYDDPVSDRDLSSKGIIWINAVHPIIVKYDNVKANEDVRNENIANFVLMIVAQYYAQKESELQPEDERDDQLLLFRKYFFKLQMEIRNDEEISYYEKD